MGTRELGGRSGLVRSGLAFAGAGSNCGLGSGDPLQALKVGGATASFPGLGGHAPTQFGQPMPRRWAEETRRPVEKPTRLSTIGLNKWVESEIGASYFADERLAKRFWTLLGMLTRRVGNSLPTECEDWANAKAAYRFLSNDRVTEQEIMAGHFVSTARTVLFSTEETFLVLHDTIEFC